MLRSSRFALLATALLVVTPRAGLSQTKLLRFPAIHGDRVAFTYAGDLWTAPAEGGTATRLTAHPGVELFARFSPDGHWIAFTGQYDGDEQVYVIPATGEEPRPGWVAVTGRARGDVPHDVPTAGHDRRIGGG